MGWTLVEQGWTLSNTSRVTCLGPQGPQKVTRGVPRGPKTAIFCPKCPFLAIGTSNSSKWVGHWLDKVGYYQTHPEGSIWTLKAPKKWHRRPQRRQKWPFLEVLGPWCHFKGAQKAQTDPLNVFDNFQPYLTNGQPIWSHWECLCAKMTFVCKIWPFLGSLGPPRATFWGP